MKNATMEKTRPRLSAAKKLYTLLGLFALIFFCIFLFRCFPEGEGEYVDDVALQIRQEMAENHIELSSRGLRRTSADFREPILLAHGGDARLIVYTAELKETVSLADEGWLGLKWTSTYQEAVYYGLAEYTVDLTGLSEGDFMVNNEEKTLTVRIPYASLSPINILDHKTEYYDPQKGWAGPKAVELTAEEHGVVMQEIREQMKAQLIDEDVMALANEQAKQVVAQLLEATVQSVDPEFTVIIVQ